MPDNEFKERLRRISDKQGHLPPAGRVESSPITAESGPNLAMMVVAVMVISIGGGLLQFASEDYDKLKADGGVGLALGIGLGAVATVTWGIVLFLRSFRSRSSVSATSAARHQKSQAARRLLSGIGLSLGVATSVLLFMSAAAQNYGTATAERFGGTLMFGAGLLMSAATLIAIVTRITPGFGFFRIIWSFLAGFILTLGLGRIVNLDLLTWPAFVAFLQ